MTRSDRSKIEALNAKYRRRRMGRAASRLLVGGFWSAIVFTIVSTLVYLNVAFYRAITGSNDNRSAITSLKNDLLRVEADNIRLDGELAHMKGRLESAEKKVAWINGVDVTGIKHVPAARGK